MDRIKSPKYKDTPFDEPWQKSDANEGARVAWNEGQSQVTSDP
jgi:hypothetical protein